MRPPSRHSRALSGALFFSIYLHLSLFALVALILSVRPAGCAPEDLTLMPFEVALVPEDQVVLEKQTEQKLEELQEEEKKEQEKEKDLKGQVVDVPPPPEERQPEDSRFLSEHDSRVQQERKAPPQPFKPGKMLSDRPIPEQQRAQPPSPPEQQQIEKKAMKLAMRQPPEVPESTQQKDEQGEEALQAKPREQPKVAVRGPEIAEQQAATKQHTLEDLKLSDAELARAVGARVNDYLKDVEEGEQTLLNTKRWRFATFFNRIKRQVAENWHPDVVYRRRDPSGNVYGFRDRLTILRVELTPQGRLKEVFLEKASGIGFLDDEAMKAFRAAEPFPNPPQGLVDQDTGLISFRFGFLFEISSRSGFRIFRFQDR